MKSTTALCLAIAACAFASPASAVFKCTTAKGVVYQDRPCREGNESDVRITVNTTEATKGSTTADDTALNYARSDDPAQAAKSARTTGDGPNSAARSSGRKSNDAAGAGETQQRMPPQTMETVSPMTADDARKADPSAKYFANEGFKADGATPVQMNCESPSGERRTFYLSNGKLTSI